MSGKNELNGYIHLHNHTEYSLLDGASSIKKLVAEAKKQRAPALAITDHGNMYGAVKFYNACNEVDKKNPSDYAIKPILGCEFYFCDDISVKTGVMGSYYHLVLIAKNYDGFLNLARLNSSAFIDGFYYKPRIDLNTLAKYSEGLICTSACIGGAVPQLLLQGRYDEAKDYALKLKILFAEGDFYIEIQDHSDPTKPNDPLPELVRLERQVNPQLVQIAREIGVKVVATNDTHYIKKEDAEMHDVLLCIGTKAYHDDQKRLRFDNDQFYVKTAEEMSALFSWCPEALTTPTEIADKCNVTIEFNVYKLPVFPCPNGMDDKAYLRAETEKGLIRRYGKKVTEAHRARVSMELDVICDMGFAAYFLIVWDFIRKAREMDIPVGPGRGSGAGSLVAYALGITDVIDPMKYELIFERFLNRDRTSMPDFDIDFCYDRRDEVVSYVKNLYGEDKISKIITFGTLKKKAAVKDVARVYKVPFAEVAKLTKHINDNDKKVHLTHLLDPKDEKHFVKDLYDEYLANPVTKKILDIAMQVEDLPRHTGVHAAGVVIYNKSARECLPLARNGEDITTQFDMGEVEKLGYLKMDFLAIKTLTDIKKAQEFILKNHGKTVDFDTHNYADPEVYSYIASGKTDAVFQLESGGMKKFMSQLGPKNLEEVTAGIALYRPGPMQYISTYLKNRLKPDAIPYKTPLLKPILDVTYGVIVYQEQAMQITRTLAGYSLTRADEFRGIISKKKMDKMEKEEKTFIDGAPAYTKKGPDGQDTTVPEVPGCVKNGISADVAKAIFAEMRAFGEYAFNKSHAAVYSVLSYQTAYLKRYYPVEYLCAVLNDRLDSPDDMRTYIRVIKESGFKVLPPDINLSGVSFTPYPNMVRYGLACVKNVGEVAVTAIIAERERNGSFKDFQDFISRIGDYLNKRMFESLVQGGALDSFNLTRSTLISNYDEVLAFTEAERKRKDSPQFSMFDMLGTDASASTYKLVHMREYGLRDKLSLEKAVLGDYVTGHPLADYQEEFKEFSFNTSMLPKEKDEGEEEADTVIITAKEDDADAPLDANAELTTASPTTPILMDGMELTTGGIISDVRLKKTKDGKDMSFAILEDFYDKIEIVLFPRTHDKYKHVMVNESLVKVKGRLSIKDDSPPSVSVSEIRTWALAEKEENTNKTTLYLNILPYNEGNIARINEILMAHKGNRPVKMQIAGQLFTSEYSVNDPVIVSRELQGLLGGPNILIK